MTTYKFKAANWILFILTMILSFMAGAAIIMIASKHGYLPKGNTFVSLLTFGVLILFVIYMMRLTSFAKVEVTFDNDSISIKWLEQFLFSNKQDITIQFSEIVSYVEQSDSNWEWLKMELPDGTVYRIWHSNLMTKDDYSKFVSAFVSSIKTHNKAVRKSSVRGGLTKTIKRSKSIYETTGGLILAGFAIVIIIGLPILLFTIPPKRPTNYFVFAAGYFGAIYFLVQVYLQRRRNKDDD